MVPPLTVPGRRGSLRKGYAGPGGGWTSAQDVHEGQGLACEARLVSLHLNNVPSAVVCGGERPEATVVVEPGRGVEALVYVDNGQLVGK